MIGIVLLQARTIHIVHFLHPIIILGDFKRTVASEGLWVVGIRIISGSHGAFDFIVILH